MERDQEAGKTEEEKNRKKSGIFCYYAERGVKPMGLAGGGGGKS